VCRGYVSIGCNCSRCAAYGLVKHLLRTFLVWVASFPKVAERIMMIPYERVARAVA